MSDMPKPTVAPSIWTNSELVNLSLPVLAQAWSEAARLAGERKVPGLQKIVQVRLARVAEELISDEPTLIAMVDECQAMVAVVASDPVADEIGRRLRRGVYEYLLAIDARLHSQVEAERAAVIDPPVGVAPGAAFAPVAIETVREVIAGHLQAGRYADCAAMLIRVTSSQRGADLAELACAAGRACRAAGDRRAAAECFQASCAADPEYAPLTRPSAGR